MVSTSSISHNLLTMIKNDDQDGWQRFVTKFGPIVYGWARRCGLQTADADDIVQIVFTEVARGIEKFEREKPSDSFRGWLYRICINRVRDFVRRNKKTMAISNVDLMNTLEYSPGALNSVSSEICKAHNVEVVPEWKVLEALARIRGEFNVKSMEAFERMVIDGETAAEIGEDLGMTANAVRNAKMRVLRRLRSNLA